MSGAMVCAVHVPASPLSPCRLLQPLDAGPEDGPGGPRGAGKDQAAGGGGPDGQSRPAVDPGRVALVHLPVCGRPARGGEGAWLGLGPTRRPRADPLSLPLQTVLRIWDCLFNEGSKIIFRVALTLIKEHQALILEATSVPDICEKFKDITRGSFVTECHTFMRVGVSALLPPCVGRPALPPKQPREGLQPFQASFSWSPGCPADPGCSPLLPSYAVSPGVGPGATWGPPGSPVTSTPWFLPGLGGDRPHPRLS